MAPQLYYEWGFISVHALPGDISFMNNFSWNGFEMMTQAVVKGKTKLKILKTALDILNIEGVDAMTTSHLAAVCNINEGNLYYHFHTKQILVTTLYDIFHHHMTRLVSTSPDKVTTRSGSNMLHPIELYSDYLRSWFWLIWRFRFLFRDGPVILNQIPDLALRLRTMNREGEQVAMHVLQHMRQVGYLIIEDAELEALAANVCIIMSYWMSFLIMHRGSKVLPLRDMEWGIYQVRALYLPYASPPIHQYLKSQMELVH
ncbi:Transcriptional regulator, TetR family [Granulibacter bethesdensis]|nr:Transcriptional regulator, TetR family [Granulibacter bethesdensis]